MIFGGKPIRAGIAVGPQSTCVAVLELSGGTKPGIALLGEFAAGGDVAARDAVRRTRCRTAVVALPPEASEMLFVPRAGLTPGEFERMVEIESARFDLPFGTAEARLASEIRARPKNDSIGLLAARNVDIDQAMAVPRGLGLGVRGVVPDAFAYEELLRISGLTQPGRSTVVLEINNSAAIFHVFDAGFEARGRRIAWLNLNSDEVAVREITRTIEHFSKTLKIPPITTVLVTSEAPLALDLDALTDRAGLLVTSLDVTDKFAGYIDQRLSAAMLRALGLALCDKPRIDIQPQGGGLAAGVVAGRAAVLVGGLLTLFLVKTVVTNRVAEWSARSRMATAKQELTLLDPQVRKAAEVRVNRERITALKTRIRVLGTNAAAARLLEELAVTAAPEICFDEILLREDKVEIKIVATTPEADVPALRARFLEKLERVKRLANVGFDAPQWKDGVVRFKLEASIVPGVS